MKLSVLFENAPGENKSLEYGHGLSILIEFDGRKILFDTASGPAFLRNAKRMGIDLSDLDAVMLSHSHYDHASGFRDLLEEGFEVPSLFVGKGFFDKKYKKRGCVYSDLSAGWGMDLPTRYGVPLCTIEGTKEISPSVFLFQGFSRTDRMESVPDSFVKEVDGKIVKDDFSDEIALGVSTDNGIVLVVGCSHPGIINIVNHVERVSGKNVFALIGGIHLKDEGKERIDHVLECLSERNISVLGLCHCTGVETKKAADKFPGLELTTISTGDVLFF